MNQGNQETSDVFRDVVTKNLTEQEKKIKLQDERLSAVEGRISGSPDHTGDIREIKAAVQAIQSNTERLRFPTQKMEEFSKLLSAGISTFSQPIKSEVRHHHYVPMIIWAAIGLFLLLCLVSTGWFMTVQTMDKYQANDIQYRHLKLIDTAHSRYYFLLDSIYQVQPDSFTSAVIKGERLKQEQLETMEHLHDINKQIDNLNKKGGGK